MSSSRRNHAYAGYHPILACDIVAFGDRRPEHVQLYLRNELYSRTRSALDNSGIPFDDCYSEDRGDGLLLVPRPDVSLDAMVTSVLDNLAGEIRRQNEVAQPEARMRLRVAVHAGQVRWDRYGVTGTAVIQTFRLLEAPAFKRHMRESGARLGAIISDRLFEDVVRPDVGRADPADHERLRVEIKETSTWGWVRLRGAPVPPRTGPDVVPDDVLTLAERMLELPCTAYRDGRTALVNALPDALSRRMDRQPDPIMDAYCILRPCVETNAGVAALLDALRHLAPDPEALGGMERALAALPWLAHRDPAEP